jgi:hypothetical protein
VEILPKLLVSGATEKDNKLQRRVVMIINIIHFNRLGAEIALLTPINTLCN